MPFLTVGSPSLSLLRFPLTSGSSRVKIQGLGACKLFQDGINVEVTDIAFPGIPLDGIPVNVFIPIAPELPIKRVNIEGIPAAITGDKMTFLPLLIEDRTVIDQTRVNIG